QLRGGEKDGCEKGKTHDVVVVGVGKEHTRPDGAPGQVLFHDQPRQLADPGAEVHDDESVLFTEPQLQTRGVSAVLDGGRPGDGYGAPHAPEGQPDGHGRPPTGRRSERSLPSRSRCWPYPPPPPGRRG